MQNLSSVRLAALREMGTAPFSVASLQALFSAKDAWRIAKRLVQLGVLVRLKRDLYVVSAEVTGRRIEPLVIANRLCSPSYVSREAALSHYGMIPELVVNVTSSRLGRTVEFVTPIGGFQYDGVDRETYAIGLCEERTGEDAFLCASPEKALYDLVLARSKFVIRSRVEMRRFLYEDLRLDIGNRHLDAGLFDELIAHGRKKQTVRLMKEVLCDDAV